MFLHVHGSVIDERSQILPATDLTEECPRALTKTLGPARVLVTGVASGCMDAIGTVRGRIDAKVHPLLAHEAMAIPLQLPR